MWVHSTGLAVEELLADISGNSQRRLISERPPDQTTHSRQGGSLKLPMQYLQTTWIPKVGRRIAHNL